MVKREKSGLGSETRVLNLNSAFITFVDLEKLFHFSYAFFLTCNISIPPQYFSVVQPNYFSPETIRVNQCEKFDCGNLLKNPIGLAFKIK